VVVQQTPRVRRSHRQRGDALRRGGDRHQRVRPLPQQPPAVLVPAPEVDDLDPVPVDRAGRADLAAVGEVAPEGVRDRSVAGVQSPATRCGGTPTLKTITVSLRAPAPTPDPGCEPRQRQIREVSSRQ
jgi:hypothetical protein